MHPISETVDVAFFLPSLDGGGVEHVALNLGKALNEQGYRVDIVVVKRKGRLLDEVPPGIHVESLDAFASVLGMFKLAGYLRRRRPKTMFSGITSINLVNIWSNMLARSGTRIVISEHVAVSINVKTHPLKRVFPLLIRWFYPKADAIVAVSQGLAGDLNAVGKFPDQRVRVIYNPIVKQDGVETDLPRPDDPWFHDESDLPILLGVGRLVEQKDFHTLIHAIKLMQTPVRLIILGDGEQMDALQALVDKLDLTANVKFKGYVATPGPYMRHADLFVLSSIYEGFGNVLVEALAHGCPVVSTNCNFGPDEILEGGMYGRLVPIQQPQALADAIHATLAEPTDKERLQRRALDFSVDKAVAAYKPVLLP